MKINPLPAGFVIPAQPVKASKPPVGTDWVHEIKHDGYPMIVRRDGPTVRLYSRNAHDWTARLSAIAAAAQRIKAKSFTIDGEAVVLGPDGLSRFEELRSREAAHAAILPMPSTSSSMMARIFAIFHSWAARPRWRGCCAIPRLASYSTNTSPRTALSYSRTLASLAQRASFPSESTVPIDPVLVRSGSRSAIPPASPCSGRGVSFGTDETPGQARNDAAALGRGCRASRMRAPVIGCALATRPVYEPLRRSS
jgi:hypothetical protein